MTKLADAVKEARAAVTRADVAFMDASAGSPEEDAAEAVLDEAMEAVDAAIAAYTSAPGPRHYGMRDGESRVTESCGPCTLGEAKHCAHQWARGGDYGDIMSTIWVDVIVYDEITGEDEETVTVSIDPEPPRCAYGRGDDHEWSADHALVGGLVENPGVRGHGGGVTVATICVHCGCKRVFDAWAHRPDTGEQGLESLTYEENAMDPSAIRRALGEEEAADEERLTE